MFIVAHVTVWQLNKIALKYFMYIKSDSFQKALYTRVGIRMSVHTCIAMDCNILCWAYV